MAGFRLSKQTSQRTTESPTPNPTESASLLSRAGGAASSGLHSVGSLLSFPSRVLWGGVSGLTGHGFGSMGVLDSTGGKELSHVLAEQGIISANDPSKWEWGDFGRGLVDIAGDPTSYAGVGLLTRAGVRASRIGRVADGAVGGLERGLLRQIRHGQRGLIGLQLPFGTTSRGAIGTGPAVADRLASVGRVPGAGLLRRVAAPVVVKAKQLFHASSMNRATAPTQEMAERASNRISRGSRAAELTKVNAARNLETAHGPARPGDVERQFVEMGRPSAEMRPVVDLANQVHAQKQAIGIPTGDLENVPKAMIRTGPRRSAVTHIMDRNGNIVRTVDNLAQHRAIFNDIGDTVWEAIRNDDFDFVDRLDPAARRLFRPYIHAGLSYDDFKQSVIHQGRFASSALRPSTAVQHAPRYVPENTQWGSVGGGRSGRELSADAAIDQHRNQELFGNASTDMINRVFRRAGEVIGEAPEGMSRNEMAREIKRVIHNEFRAEDLASGTNLTGHYTVGAGTANQRTYSRARELGNFIADNPQLGREGPFTSHPLHDYDRYIKTGVEQVAKGTEALRFMGRQAAHNTGETLEHLRTNGLELAGSRSPTVRNAIESLGMNAREGGQHVLANLRPEMRRELDANALREAARLARHDRSQGSTRTIEQLIDAHLPAVHEHLLHEMRLPAAEFKSLTGFMDRRPPRTGGPLESLNTIWKANMLAHPATQVRNAGSAVVTNALQGSASPSSMSHAIDLVRGNPVSGYGHIPEIQHLMQSQGVDETEALRRLAAVYFPADHVQDLPVGQTGPGLADVARSVPGRTVSPLSDIAMGPLRAAAGYRDGQHVGMEAITPWAIAGAFGREQTDYGPAMASNMVAKNVEQPVRLGGWLGLMQQGYSADEAARLVEKAQVSYGSREFSDFEKKLKSAIPFYAFSSRAGKHVAGELTSHPGGRMAQLVKAQDREHSGDASIPDSVLSGTALPLGQSEDGTKRFITGLGLAHEPAVHTLGAIARGDIKGAGYDVLGMLNPLMKTPLEHITGQSFFQRGEPADNLDPNVGRLLSNVGVMTGLRDEKAGPVKFAGSSIAEPLVSASPLSRIVGTAKTLTDTRKGIGAKAVNTLTGARITDVSPKKQAFELMRRAEQLAKSEGAHSRSEVYFSKRELERLKETDPVQYARQVELQKLLNKLKAKKPAKDKQAKDGQFRLSKAAK